MVDLVYVSECVWDYVKILSKILEQTNFKKNNRSNNENSYYKNTQ
jgi:hypothetical protein